MIKYPKICFLIPYFGKWPEWINFYLLSCKFNSSLDWHFFTDCGKPSETPENVFIHDINLDAFNKLASQNLDLEINIQNPYKLCDLKPAYAVIFNKYIRDYDFWSYGDIDVIYGNINNFYTQELLRDYDIISNHTNFVTGHFCTLRNNPKVNHLYQIGGAYKSAFKNPKYVGFDEQFLSIKTSTNPKFLKLANKINLKIHIFFNSIIKSRLANALRPLKVVLKKPDTKKVGDFTSIVFSMKDKKLLKAFFKTTFQSDLMLRKYGISNWNFMWEDGKLINSNTKKEVLYFHFIISKNSKQFRIREYNREPLAFTINKYGIKAVIE